MRTNKEQGTTEKKYTQLGICSYVLLQRSNHEAGCNTDGRNSNCLQSSDQDVKEDQKESEGWY